MRIFAAVRQSNDPKQFLGGLWTANFYPAWRALGHELIESQTDLLPTSRFMGIAGDFTPQELEVRARTTERILDEVRAAHTRQPIDLFLSYFYNSHFDPAGFDELRRLGIPSVNFYCNSLYQFALVAAVAAKADVAWHAERDATPLYKAAGANPVWVQMAADPEVYHPVDGVTRQPSMCFVGQRYADRDRWAAALIRAGLPVALYGSGWGADEPTPAGQEDEPESDGYLGRPSPRPGSIQSYWRAFDDERRAQGLVGASRRTVRQWSYRSETRKLAPLLKAAARGRARSLAETFAEHEVVLNFSNVWSDGRPCSGLIPHVRLRDFEGPMSGACYLTGHTDEIAEFYDIGSEIDTYSTEEELVDKGRFYLAQPAAAARLREAGLRRARRDHTWTQRFRELFHKLRLAA